MSEIKTISTPSAPAAIGPYSQAMSACGLLFCSGQIPLDPATGQIVSGGVEAQARRALDNLKAVAEAGGSSLARAVKVGLFLKSMDDFAAVNKIYELYFPGKPARVTVEVARLPRDVLVEVDCIAVLG